MNVKSCNIIKINERAIFCRKQNRSRNKNITFGKVNKQRGKNYEFIWTRLFKMTDEGFGKKLESNTFPTRRRRRRRREKSVSVETE